MPDKASSLKALRSTDFSTCDLEKIVDLSAAAYWIQNYDSYDEYDQRPVHYYELLDQKQLKIILTRIINDNLKVDSSLIIYLVNQLSAETLITFDTLISYYYNKIEESSMMEMSKDIGIYLNILGKMQYEKIEVLSSQEQVPTHIKMFINLDKTSSKYVLNDHSKTLMRILKNHKAELQNAIFEAPDKNYDLARRYLQNVNCILPVNKFGNVDLKTELPFFTRLLIEKNIELNEEDILNLFRYLTVDNLFDEDKSMLDASKSLLNTVINYKKSPIDLDYLILILIGRSVEHNAQFKNNSWFFNTEQESGSTRDAKAIIHGDFSKEVKLKKLYELLEPKTKITRSRRNVLIAEMNIQIVKLLEFYQGLKSLEEDPASRIEFPKF